MSQLTEKIAYLHGVADTIDVKDENLKKLLKALMEALTEVGATLEQQDQSISDLEEDVEDLYDELDELEDDIYEDDDEDEDFDDEDFLEIKCPNCGEKIYFDFDMLDSEDGLICPNCNQPVPLDLSGCECGCECGCEDSDGKDDQDE